MLVLESKLFILQRNKKKKRRGGEGIGGVILTETQFRIKEELRKRFAQKADDFMKRLRMIEQGIGTLSGSLSVRFCYLLPHAVYSFNNSH